MENRLKQALEWSLAEIEGQTRYDNDEQFENCLSIAKGLLSNIEIFEKTIPDTELKEWAKHRADDAGRLARELMYYRGLK